MERVNFKLGFSLGALAAAGIGIALAMGCSARDKSSESIGSTQLALTPCDPAAPFNPPVAAFTGTSMIDGITFTQDGLRAYLSGGVTTVTHDIYVAARASTSVPFTTFAQVAGLNTTLRERAPSLSGDGTSLYFGKYLSAGVRYNLLKATIDPATGVVVGTPTGLTALNTSLNDQDPFFFSSTNELYFATEPVDGQRDLRVSQGPAFASATTLSLSTTAYDEYRPVLSPDGLTLYFASTRPGLDLDTSGDIWLVKRTATNVPFPSDPGQLSNASALNGSRVEYPAGISNDGCTLYFASNRDVSNAGLFRLYQATRGTSVPTTVTTTLKIVGAGSVVTPPYQCSTTCTFEGTPDSSVPIAASAQAIWSGSCSPSGGLSSDGVFVFTNGGTCTITFPDGPAGPGEGCGNPAGCEPGLECTLNVCRCPPGTPDCICTPTCPSNACNADDGCGGTCPCAPGEPCVDNTDCAAGAECCGGVCGGDGCECSTGSQCAPGFECANDECTSCATNPTAPGCLPSHCSNDVQDVDESDVDCGGSCEGCDPGNACASTADCGDGLECGTNNGACFGTGKPRAQSVCWPAACADGVEPSECGESNSPCGQNCSCFNSCDTDAASSTCPSSEICKRGLGSVVGGSTRDVCTHDDCPSNDPTQCGTKSSLCGEHCICTPNCAAATCANPGDGCMGECRAVCDNGDVCTKDIHCPVGSSCPLTSNGPRVCRPDICTERAIRPPLCGTPGAVCGACPTCTPQCDGKQCGLDANCGQSCGTCAAGSYCNGVGQCVSPSSDPFATFPTGGGGAGNVPDLPGAPASAVGALAGQFAVTEQGTAAYTIPIEVPPGRAGLEPSLSLRYAASRSPGDLGVGWHIDGLSKITRCARTNALDGYAAPVKNDETDRFCLDGKRLAALPGHQYGSDRAEYRTVVDTFSKVVSFVDVNLPGIQLDNVQGVIRAAREKQGPDYFEVRTKDGRILTFGKTRDSLVVGFTGVRQTWLLNRVQDRAGNTILIEYETAGSSVLPRNGAVYPGAARPSVISYTGHGDVAGNRQVRFAYESRQDPSVRYLQGGLAAMTTERLRRITTYVNWEPVRNYRLDYKLQELSQVEAIAECAGGDDSACKPRTTFEYVEESGFEPIRFAPLVTNSSVQLDVNGDGFPDFINTSTTIDGVPAKPGLIAAQLSTEVAVFIATTFILAPEIGVPVAIGWAIIKPFVWGIFADEPKIVTKNAMLFGSASRPPPDVGSIVTGLPCGNGFPMYLLDVNKDGRDDVAGRCFGSWILHSLSTGDGHLQPASSVTAPFVAIDLPGPTLSPTGPEPVVYDVNGDALEDVVSCADNRTLEFRRRLGPDAGFAPVLRLTSGSFPPLPPPLDTSVPMPLCSQSRPTHQIVDVDGDGTSELLARGGDGWKVLRYLPGSSDGPLAWEPVAFEDWNSSELGRGLQVGDLNADGLADFSSVRDGDATIWMNMGRAGFSALKLARPTPAPSDHRYAQSVLLDYNADGRTDLLEKWVLDGFTSDFYFNVALTPTSNLSELLPVEAADIQARNGLGIMLPAEFNTSGDVDADGNADLIGPQGIWYGKGAKNMLLSRVEDGLGNVIRVAYDAAGTYSHTCTGSNWPEACLRRMTNLVSRHTEGVIDNDGSEVVEREYRYAYWNARYNVAGHGWLGFERRVVVGPEAKITTDVVPPARYTPWGGLATTTPPYVYPLAGMPARVVMDRARGQSPLETAEFEERTRIENTWEVSVSADGMPFPKLSTRTTIVYDREVPPPAIPATVRDFEDNGIKLTDHVENFSTDPYGNVTGHNERWVDGGEMAYERRSTVSGFFPDRSSWLISNPHMTIVDSQRHGQGKAQSWNFEYDERGLLKSVTRSQAGPANERHKTTYQRDAFGNPFQVIEEVTSGEAPRTTSITYDADNVYPLTITNPLGHVTQARFDKRWGSIKTIVDPNGVTTRRAFDGLGLLAETRDPEGTTLYGYASLPLDVQAGETLVGRIRPRLRTTVDRQGTNGTRTGSEVRETDGYGRTVRTQLEGLEGAAVVTERAYDARGRMIGMTKPHTVGALVVPTTEFTYDGLDRVTLAVRSDGSSVSKQHATPNTIKLEHQHWMGGVDCTYSHLPCISGVELVTDEEGRRDVQVLDHRGLVLRSIDGNYVDGAARSSNYLYGAFNHLISTRDNAGNLTSFGHDAYGRRTSHTDPDIGETLYFYNGYDELKTSIDPSQQRLFDYDALGRIGSILDASGLTTWTYDVGTNGLGQLSEMASPGTPENPAGHRVIYTYEPQTADPNRGLLKTLYYVIDGLSYPVTFNYDDLGRTDRIDYPDLGTGSPIAAKYTYDTSGVLWRLDEVGGGTTKPIWRMTDAFQGHLVEKEIFGNGAETTYAYDSQRRWLDSIATSLGGTSIQSLSYTHYDNGLIFERTSNDLKRVHTYDELNRLYGTVDTNAGVPVTSASYLYDLAGNITQRGSKVLTYQTAKPHFLDTVNGNAYQYDLRGNVRYRAGPDVPGGLQTIDYTPFDLPQTITTGQGTSERITRFEYTADEERLVRRDETTTRHFVTDLYQRLINNTGSTTTEERFQLYAGDRPVAEIVRKNGTDETLYFHTDELGSISTLSNDAGASFQQEFDVFGALLSSPNPELTRAGYTGHQHERDLGLIDMRGRMYDPLAGRFLSADPVSQAPFWSQGLNRYSYVFNDPVNNTDPSGFFGIGASVSIVAGFRGGMYFVTTGVGLAASLGGLGLNMGVTGATGIRGFGSAGSTIAGGPMGGSLAAPPTRYYDIRPDLGGGGGSRPGPMGGTPPGGGAAPRVAPKAPSPGSPAPAPGARPSPPPAPGADALPPGVKPGSAGGPGAGKRIGPKTADAAEAEAGGKCVYCGVKTTKGPGPTQRNADHAIPRSRGGNNTLLNTENTCRTCNLDKSARTSHEYMEILRGRSFLLP
jgi:RHS repeat-associated protein